MSDATTLYYANPFPLWSITQMCYLVCSNSCRMGRLHSVGQPIKGTLTVLKNCSPQEPWWTWLTRLVSDTKLMCLYRQHVCDHHIIKNYLHVPYSPENTPPSNLRPPSQSRKCIAEVFSTSIIRPLTPSNYGRFNNSSC